MNRELAVERDIRFEVLGILGVAISLFIFAALISYSPNDPCLTTYSFHGSTNWMGPVGAHLAAFLFTIFGYASYWIPLLILAVSWPFLKGYGWSKAIVWVVGGWIQLLIATSIALSYWIQNGTEISNTHLSMAGGVLGIEISNFLINWFGAGGLVLFVIVLSLTGIVTATPISIVSVIENSILYLKNKTKEKTQKISLKDTSIKLDTDNPKELTKEDELPIPHIVSPPKPEKEETSSSKEKTEFHLEAPKGEFKLPPLDLLEDIDSEDAKIPKEVYLTNAQILEQKLKDFGVSGKIVEICPGPVITMYEFSPAPGVKINKIASLADDLALALKSTSIRIVAPIPGKGVIGIELANPKRQIVSLKALLASKAFKNHKGTLPLALGQDIVGQPVVTDLSKMPHLLIAGATGTGKSVGLNAMICSLLYRHFPDKLRLLMIDPKRIELSLYDGIPHLLHPVVNEPKEATRALRWAVMEMERRYSLLEEAKCRNLEGYNKKVDEPLPYLVIIIDELADLMMVSSKEVESSIARLAQMARAAGIHLIVATQRPSVDVLTGLIKANFPARISFKVSSKVDSRTILDITGAERLLGMGDMLFLAPGTATPERIHGAYVSEAEISKIVEFLKVQAEPEYDLSVVEPVAGEEEAVKTGSGNEEFDEKYDEAVEIVTSTGHASISMLQRRLRIGYNRAARIIEQMEKEGIVSPTDAMGRRKVLARDLSKL